MRWPSGRDVRQLLGHRHPSGVWRLLQPLVADVQANLDSGFPRLKRLLETGSPD